MANKLKHMFFTRESLTAFADSIKREYAAFDKKTFLSLVFDKNWESLELKARMRHTTLCLCKMLPESYRDALAILTAIAPEIKGFEAMVLPDFVEVFGLDDGEASLPALRHFTRFSSSEFAIRPFLKNDPAGVMKVMSGWAEDENDTVRRLASEGCRPRLPWAMALPAFKKDPSLILPILEKLKADPSETVRRSVANNLNDISKDNPETALELCEKWYGTSELTDKIVKHACRSMLKAGNKRALMLFGYSDPSQTTVKNLSLAPNPVKIGENLHFSFVFVNNSGKTTDIRIEYAIDYIKATGNTSRKIFKITENAFEPGEHTFSRKQTFAEMTTRKQYPGTHSITIIVNGEGKVTASFKVTA